MCSGKAGGNTGLRHLHDPKDICHFRSVLLLVTNFCQKCALKAVPISLNIQRVFPVQYSKVLWYHHHPSRHARRRKGEGTFWFCQEMKAELENATVGSLRTSWDGNPIQPSFYRAVNVIISKREGNLTQTEGNLNSQADQRQLPKL